MSIWVLRLGHRLPRDERVSTHCGLVSRALGADGILFSGQEDKGLLVSIRKTTQKWGGKFQAKYVKNWKKAIKEFKEKGYYIVLLTMYGVNLPDIIEKIRRKKDILIIIGSEKVPGDVYELCDSQVAVGNQPHSEIAALGLFLDRYFQGKELERGFQGKIKIIPQEQGKKTSKS
jgi:tRNA (cytidine56-2'-O)-methyltransferase